MTVSTYRVRLPSAKGDLARRMSDTVYSEISKKGETEASSPADAIGKIIARGVRAVAPSLDREEVRHATGKIVARLKSHKKGGVAIYATQIERGDVEGQEPLPYAGPNSSLEAVVAQEQDVFGFVGAPRTY